MDWEKRQGKWGEDLKIPKKKKQPLVSNSKGHTGLAEEWRVETQIM
jgi:hypothetical protein